MIRRGEGDLCEGHDGHETEAKTESNIPVQMVCDDTERDEYEQDIEPGSKEEPFVGLNPSRLVLCLEN